MTALQLSDDQQAAYDAIFAFISSRVNDSFVISGYAGTGKTTLLDQIIRDIPLFLKTLRAVDASIKNMDIHVTATTNKAASALRECVPSSVDVVTVHKLLGLQVRQNYQTGKTELIEGKKSRIIENAIIFIDEASFVDNQLLERIFARTKNCKLIFVGDPAQLPPVKAKTGPVFTANMPGVTLSQVVRQAENNQIIELSTAFRDTVNSGEYFKFKPNGIHVEHMSTEDFDNKIIAEFNRGNWDPKESKVLAYTNQTVVDYNKGIMQAVKGVDDIHPGVYAVCNNYIFNLDFQVSTDEIVKVIAMNPTSYMDVAGNWVEFESSTGTHSAFLPDNFADRKKLVATLKKQKSWSMLNQLDTNWIDLRATYSCTINKSQGSTYDRVFIDLDDVSKCKQKDLIPRLLYVAVSRARHNVYIKGDIA